MQYIVHGRGHLFQTVYVPFSCCAESATFVIILGDYACVHSLVTNTELQPTAALVFFALVGYTLNSEYRDCRRS